MDNKFTEKDKEKMVAFLNFIADKAKFEMDVKEVIKFYGLLSWAQVQLLKKMDSHVFEYIGTHEPEPKKPTKKKATK